MLSKGTSKVLIENINIPQISTGDILRAAIMIKLIWEWKQKFMDEGKLVPDSNNYWYYQR